MSNDNDKNDEMHHQHPRSTQNATSNQPRRGIFVLPILGFFHNYDEPSSNNDNETSVLLSSSESSQQQQQQQPEDEEESKKMYDEKDTTTTVLPLYDSTVATTQNNNDKDNGDTSDKKSLPTRTRQLWQEVARHVQGETFQIKCFTVDEEHKNHDDSDGDVYQDSNGQDQGRRGSSRATTKRRIDEELEDLPYDFSMTEVMLALLVYLVLSVLSYSFVFEQFSVIDSMYFAVVTFTTTGYGDVVPTTQGGKLFTTFFAMGGIVILGVGLGVVGSQLVESQVEALDRARQDLRKDLLGIVDDTTTGTSSPKGNTLTSSIDVGGATDLVSMVHNDEHESKSLDDGKLHIRREIKRYCATLTQLLLKFSPSLVPLFLSAFWIGHQEGWTWVDALYYCVITTTTVGYGDLAPQRESIRLFAVFFIPVAVGIMGYLLGMMANFVLERRRMLYHKKLCLHELSLDDLDVMDIDKDGSVSELEYMIFMLQAMKKVDKELIDALRNRFQRLDLTESGTLVRKDLELMAKRRLRRTRRKLELSSYKYRLTHSSG